MVPTRLASPLRRVFWNLVATSLVLMAASLSRAEETRRTTMTNFDSQRAKAELLHALSSQPKWIKVHAAEALIDLGQSEEARDAFLKEWAEFENQPQYRIGIMRVLARAHHKEVDRLEWADRIKKALFDAAGADQIHAAESASKLNLSFSPSEIVQLEELVERSQPDLAVNSCWALALQGGSEYRKQLVEFVGSTDPNLRSVAAYAMGRLPLLAPDASQELYDAASSEQAESSAFAYLTSASFVVASQNGNATEAQRCRAALVNLLREGTSAAQREACYAIATAGSGADLELVRDLLDHADPDVRVSAASAVLQLYRRSRLLNRRLWDWTVIGLYGVGLLAVGVYCSRKATTTDEYLLGGRAMKPLMVGMSLFASLLSTISYLATPGEMIQHGPMIASEIVVYPLIIFFVGKWIIPRFMKVRVSTAYEILETQLGSSVRLLGALQFLSMRLLWMALIIHTTTSLVIVPLLGISPHAAPYASAVLGLLTLTYSSIGGFRAVVITDTIQSVILLSGAVLTIVLISIDLGGVGAWWPSTWISTWDTPRFWFDPASRVTFASAFLAAISWFICTAGSDQMSVQRYLATRDARAATKMYGISLGANALATVLLAILGLALLSYSAVHPELMGYHLDTQRHADQLLPRFIAVALPAGVSGLVIAALLSAAMGALSSGISSSCSVITVDLVGRHRRGATEDTNLRTSRLISWTIGAVVVALSLVMGRIPGNLLEVTSKVVNLMVAPLFVLFFMALYVPWASPSGAIVGSLASLVVGAAIAFLQIFGLSFLWIIPVSLVVGVLVGALISAVVKSDAPQRDAR